MVEDIAEMRIREKHRRILLFMYIVENAITQYDLYGVLGIPIPPAHTDYKNTRNTLKSLEKYQLIQCIPLGGHNRMKWSLTERGRIEGEAYLQEWSEVQKRIELVFYEAKLIAAREGRDIKSLISKEEQPNGEG